MVLDDLAQVVSFEELLEVEDAFDRGGMVSGAEEKVGESGVAEEEVAAEEVQCCVSLSSLAWFHTKNCLGRRTISNVTTEGLGRVALARRLVPSSRASMSVLSSIENPVKLFKADPS